MASQDDADDDPFSHSHDYDNDLVNENDDEYEDDDDEEEEEVEELDLYDHPINLNSSASDPKRPRFETIILPPPDQKPQPIDETRRLFQRLWNDEDEIELLQGFLHYTTQRGPAHHDTAQFYDQIKSKLQLDFNKNQLVEKLRRLKKKYRNVMAKITSGKQVYFKTPHDQGTFEISRRIWSSSAAAAAAGGSHLDEDDGDEVKPLDYRMHNSFSAPPPPPASRKRPRSKSLTGIGLGPTTPAPIGVRVDENSNANNNNNNKASSGSGNSNNSTNRVGSGVSNASVSGLVEETVRSCLSPLFKELLSGSGRVVGGLVPWGFGGERDLMMVAASDERWRKQQILELEVYSKRLELVQDQIRAQLQELRSSPGAGS